jgi:hypothetical protein
VTTSSLWVNPNASAESLSQRLVNAQAAVATFRLDVASVKHSDNPEVELWQRLYRPKLQLQWAEQDVAEIQRAIAEQDPEELKE